jgi:hypothetical protein
MINGERADSFPQAMTVLGVVEEVSQVPDSCAAPCWSGTMKIRLSEEVRRYGHEYVYVVVPCSIGRIQDYREFVVKLSVTKLDEKKRHRCGKIINTIDSGGLPYYRLAGKRFRILGGP